MASDVRPLTVLQLTDTHFFATEEGRLLGVDTASSFAEVWKLARQAVGTPDFYLFTGDLSQDETRESYERLSAAVSDAGAPCYSLPGNHDRRHELASGLSGSGVFKPDRTIASGNWYFILLDSLVEGEVGGHLTDAELERLEAELEKSRGKHVLVAVHHQVLEMGARWLDGIGIDNAGRLLEIIDRHSHVKVVLWGHVHQEFECHRLGVSYLATPSTCVQFKPRSEDFGVDAVPPGCRVIELFDDGSVKTKVLRTAGVAAGLEVSSRGY